MKNAIIVFLTALSAFLGWQLYGLAESGSFEILQNSGIENEEREDSVLNIAVNPLINHFHKHTLNKVKNDSVFYPKEDKTDGLVTIKVSFDTTTLKNAIMYHENGLVHFYMCSFNRASAKKYVRYYNSKTPYGQDTITVSQVVQKPTLAIKVKPSVQKGTSKYVIGKICPPPANCP